LMEAELTKLKCHQLFCIWILKWPPSFTIHKCQKTNFNYRTLTLSKEHLTSLNYTGKALFTYTYIPMYFLANLLSKYILHKIQHNNNLGNYLFTYFYKMILSV
jgi:hypothetical protein